MLEHFGLLVHVKIDSNATAHKEIQLCASSIVAAVWGRNTYKCDERIFGCIVCIMTKAYFK